MNDVAGPNKINNDSEGVKKRKRKIKNLRKKPLDDAQRDSSPDSTTCDKQCAGSVQNPSPQEVPLVQQELEDINSASSMVIRALSDMLASLNCMWKRISHTDENIESITAKIGEIEKKLEEIKRCSREGDDLPDDTRSFGQTGEAFSCHVDYPALSLQRLDNVLPVGGKIILVSVLEKSKESFSAESIEKCFENSKTLIKSPSSSFSSDDEAVLSTFPHNKRKSRCEQVSLESFHGDDTSLQSPDVEKKIEETEDKSTEWILPTIDAHNREKETFTKPYEGGVVISKTDKHVTFESPQYRRSPKRTISSISYEGWKTEAKLNLQDQEGNDNPEGYLSLEWNVCEKLVSCDSPEESKWEFYFESSQCEMNCLKVKNSFHDTLEENDVSCNKTVRASFRNEPTLLKRAVSTTTTNNSFTSVKAAETVSSSEVVSPRPLSGGNTFPSFKNNNVDISSCLEDKVFSEDRPCDNEQEEKSVEKMDRRLLFTYQNVCKLIQSGKDHSPNSGRKECVPYTRNETSDKNIWRNGFLKDFKHVILPNKENLNYFRGCSPSPSDEDISQKRGVCRKNIYVPRESPQEGCEVNFLDLSEPVRARHDLEIKLFEDPSQNNENKTENSEILPVDVITVTNCRRMESVTTVESCHSDEKCSPFQGVGSVVISVKPKSLQDSSPIPESPKSRPWSKKLDFLLKPKTETDPLKFQMPSQPPEETFLNNFAENMEISQNLSPSPNDGILTVLPEATNSQTQIKNDKLPDPDLMNTSSNQDCEINRKCSNPKILKEESLDASVEHTPSISETRMLKSRTAEVSSCSKTMPKPVTSVYTSRKFAPIWRLLHPKQNVLKSSSTFMSGLENYSAYKSLNQQFPHRANSILDSEAKPIYYSKPHFSTLTSIWKTKLFEKLKDIDIMKGDNDGIENISGLNCVSASQEKISCLVNRDVKIPTATTNGNSPDAVLSNHQTILNSNMSTYPKNMEIPNNTNLGDVPTDKNSYDLSTIQHSKTSPLGTFFTGPKNTTTMKNPFLATSKNRVPVTHPRSPRMASSENAVSAGPTKVSRSASHLRCKPSVTRNKRLERATSSKIPHNITKNNEQCQHRGKDNKSKITSITQTEAYPKCTKSVRFCVNRQNASESPVLSNSAGVLQTTNILKSKLGFAHTNRLDDSLTSKTPQNVKCPENHKNATCKIVQDSKSKSPKIPKNYASGNEIKTFENSQNSATTKPPVSGNSGKIPSATSHLKRKHTATHSKQLETSTTKNTQNIRSADNHLNATCQNEIVNKSKFPKTPPNETPPKYPQKSTSSENPQIITSRIFQPVTECPPKETNFHLHLHIPRDGLTESNQKRPPSASLPRIPQTARTAKTFAPQLSLPRIVHKPVTPLRTKKKETNLVQAKDSLSVFRETQKESKKSNCTNSPSNKTIVEVSSPHNSASATNAPVASRASPKSQLNRRKSTTRIKCESATNRSLAVKRTVCSKGFPVELNSASKPASANRGQYVTDIRSGPCGERMVRSTWSRDNAPPTPRVVAKGITSSHGTRGTSAQPRALRLTTSAPSPGPGPFSAPPSASPSPPVTQSGERRSLRKPSPRSVANSSLRDRLGRELVRAVHFGRLKDARMLLDLGADANFTLASDWTPLQRACRVANKDIVELLIKRGSDVRAKTSYGFTALHVAAYNDYSGACTKLLVDAGCDVDAVNQSGRTALHSAAESDNALATVALLAAGADGMALNDEGKRPVDLARTDFMRALLRPMSPKR